MIFWIVWFVIGIAFVAVFACFVLPKLYLKAFASIHPVRDRALGKYNFDNGVSILYEPSVSIKKYLKKYQIYQRNDKRELYFVGKWAQPIDTVDYGLIVFDKRNNIISRLRLRGSVAGRPNTRTVQLPSDTDYVSVVIYGVNDKKVSRERKITSWTFVWNTLFWVGFAFAADLLLWLMFTFITVSSGLAGSATNIGIPSSDTLTKICIALDVVVVGIPLLIIFACWLYQRFGQSLRRLLLIANRGIKANRKSAKSSKTQSKSFRQKFLQVIYAIDNFFLSIIWSRPIQAIWKIVQNIFFKIKGFFVKLQHRKKGR